MITVYSKPNCSQCTATKLYLDRLGANYTTVDVSVDQEGLALVRNLGYLQAPVVTDGNGNHWSGFNAEKLNVAVL